MLELYNLDYSKDIAYYSNSTHNLVTTFRKVTLNREASRLLRKAFEASISRKGSSSYSVKDTSLDIYSRSKKL